MDIINRHKWIEDKIKELQDKGYSRNRAVSVACEMWIDKKKEKRENNE